MLSTKYSKKVCLSYININPVRNKLEALSKFVCTQVDFLAIGKTKLDSSFPTAQLNIPGFRIPYRKDTTARNWGLLVYINGDIPSRVTYIRQCPSDIQVLPVQMNLKRQRWLAVAIYTPRSQCYFITDSLVYYKTNEGFR